MRRTGGDALEFSRTFSTRFSRQSRKNGSLCPNTSKCLPSRLWEWRLRRQISYSRKNNSPTYAGYLLFFFIATYQIFSPRLFCGSFARDILLSRFPIFWQRACSQSIILFVKSHSVSPLDSLKKKKNKKQNKTKNNNNNTNNGDSRFDCKIRKSWYEKMLPLNCISTWSWKCLMEGLLFYNLGVKSRA